MIEHLVSPQIRGILNKDAPSNKDAPPLIREGLANKGGVSLLRIPLISFFREKNMVARDRLGRFL